MKLVSNIFQIQRSIVVFYTLVVLGFSNNAQAYCYEPTMYENPPDVPGSYERPDPPYCLSGYSYTRRHTCETWEINSYIDDLNEYIRKLNDYVDAANSYASAAAQFANEAYEYAECEAEDVKSEIE